MPTSQPGLKRELARNALFLTSISVCNAAHLTDDAASPGGSDTHNAPL